MLCCPALVDYHLCSNAWARWEQDSLRAWSDKAQQQTVAGRQHGPFRSTGGVATSPG